MENHPPKSVFFHFRFKFLAITNIAFLLYVILSGAAEFDQFVDTVQFKLIGPFFLVAGMLYLLFRKFPIKCPYCNKITPSKKDWQCPECKKMQGKERALVDKCVHCKQIMATSFCDHCNKEFKL